MESYTDHESLALKICEIFGLKRVSSLKLILEKHMIPIVEVKFYPEEKDLKSLLPIFEKYKLEKIE